MKIVFLTIIAIILTASISDHTTVFAQEYPELGVRVEVVAENLSVPWSIDRTPDGMILFTERNGNLRIIQDGELLREPLLSLGVGGVEGGMLGIAVDPDYSENHFWDFETEWHKLTLHLAL